MGKKRKQKINSDLRMWRPTFQKKQLRVIIIED